MAGGAVKLLSTRVNQLCVTSNTQQAANERRCSVAADNRLMICCRQLFKTFQISLSYSSRFELQGLYLKELFRVALCYLCENGHTCTHTLLQCKSFWHFFFCMHMCFPSRCVIILLRVSLRRDSTLFGSLAVRCDSSLSSTSQRPLVPQPRSTRMRGRCLGGWLIFTSAVPCFPASALSLIHPNAFILHVCFSEQSHTNKTQSPKRKQTVWNHVWKQPRTRT